ncbi:MAG: hypothetical protein JKY41_16080 [Rhodobacteraceae bacterium]|nr:hypothetical protein [Paracoccaceae bacterium]
MENASDGINNELVVASNFTFGGDDAYWAAGYIPISGQHGTSWGTGGLDAQGRTWSENTYDNWSNVSDADLVAMYTADYNNATTSYDPTRADYVAVQETLLTERGIPIPSGT